MRTDLKRVRVSTPSGKFDKARITVDEEDKARLYSEDRRSVQLVRTAGFEREEKLTGKKTLIHTDEGTWEAHTFCPCSAGKLAALRVEELPT